MDEKIGGRKMEKIKLLELIEELKNDIKEIEEKILMDEYADHELEDVKWALESALGEIKYAFQ